MHEARIEGTDEGVVPADDGWFILNLEQIAWETVPRGGTWCVFESPGSPSPLLGIGVHVLAPGEASGLYHAESNQEGFLVLSGECVAIVEGQERRLRQWDYLHCPPGTGAHHDRRGRRPVRDPDGRYALPDRTIEYPVEPAAARYGAAVERATDSPREAYAGWPPFVRTRSPWPLAAEERR